MGYTSFNESKESQRTEPQVSLLLCIAPLLLPLAAIAGAAITLGLRADRVPDMVGICLCLSVLGILPAAILIGTCLLVCDVLYKQHRLIWLSLLGTTTVAAFILGLVVGPMFDF